MADNAVAAAGWMLLLAPVAAAAVILLVGIQRKRLSAAVAIAGLLVSFCCTAWLFLMAATGRLTLPYELSIAWLDLPDFAIGFGVLLDRLSLLMSLVVTGVGSAIFIYSTGYMRDDTGYSRYFGVLSLFAFSMLTIVVATNWLQLFMGWELVGFCSYLLIGHWYEKPAAAEAGKKAFMVNRVADFGFMLGIIMLWALSSKSPAGATVHFATLQRELPLLVLSQLASAKSLAVIGLLIFCGVLGKSAQMPLHVWLPDAMEGPTPVSALIHAATMVAAGVYMLCRSFWLFEDLPGVLNTIAWVGGATAFFAAWLALVEADLKRILAYSTLSQLGYMVMAVGLGGALPGMYHLTTHAFFKALLFLAAGSVIHGTHKQNIWELGGLQQSMPWTSRAFLVGSLCLIGFPGLGGFFSKDEILALACERNVALYVIGTFTAGLTAFYTTRAWLVAFAGKPPHELHAHESPPAILGPLAFLALLSVIGGYLGIPALLGEHFHHAHPEAFNWTVASVSIAVVAAGVAAAYAIYGRRIVSADELSRRFAGPYQLLARRYYVDDVYGWYVEKVQQPFFAGTCALVERSVIIGFAVNGTAWLTKTAGRILRRAQTGAVQSYALVFFIGVVALLYITLR